MKEKLELILIKKESTIKLQKNEGFKIWWIFSKECRKYH